MIGVSSCEDKRLLPDNLGDHIFSSGSDGLHGESGEPVRKHGTEKKSGEGKGVEDVNGDNFSGDSCDTGDEGTEKSEGDEGGGADSETFSNGGGGVSCGIEVIGVFADYFVKL